jgi:hypothetical protein
MGSVSSVVGPSKLPAVGGKATVAVMAAFKDGETGLIEGAAISVAIGRDP